MGYLVKLLPTLFNPQILFDVEVLTKLMVVVTASPVVTNTSLVYKYLLMQELIKNHLLTSNRTESELILHVAR